MRIFNANLELAVADLLVMIEAIVSGYGGGDGDGQKVDEECAEGAVGDAAEEAAHTDGSGEPAGDAHERSDDGSE